MKPILIDVSKFGGAAVLPELQKLVDDAYNQGLKDGARKVSSIDDSLGTPQIYFDRDTMKMSNWTISDET